MTKTFYTNVQNFGSKILYRGIENGRRITRKLDYNPTLFLPSQKPTKFTTIKGEYVADINPGTIADCREFVKKYEDVENFKVYGNQKYEYCYISDQHPNDVDWDKSFINICNIDIEVGSENGFPEPDVANEPITAITYKMNDMFIVYGCGHFTNEREDVQYIRCDDEIDLIKRFVDGWSGNYPDIITGWNVKMFDIPYLINRITKLMGEAFAKRLSPWNYLSERTVNFGVSRQFKTYNLVGISCLDYIDLYQRYAPEGKSQESYKLDNIANVELNERKLSYEEYGNLHTLYRDNYQLFIEYNIKDTELVERLEDKLKLIELALTLAYDSKTNYDDVFAQVRMWDALIYNHLKSKNMVVPPIEHQEKNEAYVGAYVKDPIVGMHNWVASLDLNSLYPSLIMQYNISPEMHMTKSRVQYRMEELEKNVKEMTREELQEELEDLKKIQKITSQVDVNNMVNKEIDLSILKKYNMTITPNGELFEVVSQGFLSEMMEKMYNDRTVYKKKAIEAKKDLEKVMAEINRRKKV